MRKLLNQVSARLGDFVDQRDDLVLVLRADVGDALPLLSILEGLEGERASDFFWTFTDAFENPRSYADAVVEAFTTKHTAVRLAMEKEGLTPWPAIPPAVSDRENPPAARIRALAAFSRELLPVPNGGVCVWTFFPLEVADARAYARFIADVIAHDFPFPWCHHLRFLVRIDSDDRVLEHALGSTAHVQRYSPDLSVDALNRSVEEEVDDESLPLAERMASLLISAGNDLAFSRFPLALEKFALLLQYHGSMNSFAMAALALNGMGQVYYRMGDLERANEAYLSALIPASEGDPPAIPVLLNVVLNLADLRMQQQNWVEAEGYWDAAQQLATVARDGQLKVRALGQRGLCQRNQDLTEEAEKSWQAASVIAAQLEDKNLCADQLEHLYRLYRAQRNASRAQEVREQLAGLGRRAEAA
jgi:tetratricopeptide (TPR) repeat protein